MIKNIIILVLGFFVWLAYFDEAHSANQENQYCDIKTTLVKTVDKNGKTINELEKKYGFKVDYLPRRYIENSYLLNRSR